MSLPWGGPEREDVERQIEELDAAEFKKLPNQRHALRMESLYVGLSEDRKSWVRPLEMRGEEAHVQVEHAVADFNCLVVNLGSVAAEDPFSRAYKAWADGPRIMPMNIPRLG
jgi:hypothetical protein